MPVRVKDRASISYLVLDDPVNLLGIDWCLSQAIRMVGTFSSAIMKVDDAILISNFMLLAIVTEVRIPKGATDGKDTRNLAVAIETVNSR